MDAVDCATMMVATPMLAKHEIDQEKATGECNDTAAAMMMMVTVASLSMLMPPPPQIHDHQRHHHVIERLTCTDRQSHCQEGSIPPGVGLIM